MMATIIQQISDTGKLELTPWADGSVSTARDETSLSTIDGGSLVGNPAAYDQDKERFTQQITIEQNASFRVKGFTITSGALKGIDVILMAPAGDFRFLDLPAELRNMVYRYVVPESQRVRLVMSKSLCISSGHKRARVVRAESTYRTKKANRRNDVSEETFKKQQCHFSHALDLLQVNQQIQDEVVGILYGGNAFHFRSDLALKLFLKTSKHSHHIRHIVLSANRSNSLRRSLLNVPGFTNLRVLECDHDIMCRRGVMECDAEELVNACLPMLNKVWRTIQDHDIYENKLLAVFRLNECSCLRCESNRRGDNDDTAPKFRYYACGVQCCDRSKTLLEDIKKVISRRFDLARF